MGDWDLLIWTLGPTIAVAIFVSLVPTSLLEAAAMLEMDVPLGVPPLTRTSIQATAVTGDEMSPTFQVTALPAGAPLKVPGPLAMPGGPTSTMVVLGGTESRMEKLVVF